MVEGEDGDDYSDSENGYEYDDDDKEKPDFYDFSDANNCFVHDDG